MSRTFRFAIAAAAVFAAAFPALAEGDTAAPAACPETVEQTLYQRIYYLVRGQTNAQQTYAIAQQVEAVCADRPEALGLAALIYSNLYSPDADQLTRHTLLDGIWRIQIAQDKVWNSETNKRILVHDPNNVFATTRLDTRDNLYLIFQKKVVPELMRLHVEGADVPIYDVSQQLETCPWPIEPADKSRARDEAWGLFNAVHADRSKVDIEAGAHRLRELGRVCPDQSAYMTRMLAEYLAAASRLAAKDGELDKARQYAKGAIEAGFHLLDDIPGTVGEMAYLKGQTELIIKEFQTTYPDL
ncbi:hypothetical protein WNY37_17025 [Henriciella sp. AS95]|uniref:hypothetical protein n=1 Tax=Henriciella sp. AS95 TaxID=3135782 RepID=UPI00316CF03D